MIKAILFDFDDTLVQTITSRIEALKELGSRYYDMSLTDEIIKSHWGKPWKKFFKAVYGEVDSLESLQNKYFALSEEFPIKAFPDAQETVLSLSRKYPLGIVSTASKHIISKDLKSLGFSPNTFSFIQGAEDTIVHKPDPAVFNPALNFLKSKNIVKNEIMYVGDSLADYFAARDAQLHFRGVPRGLTSKKQFESEGALVISSLRDILIM